MNLANPLLGNPMANPLLALAAAQQQQAQNQGQGQNSASQIFSGAAGLNPLQMQMNPMLMMQYMMGAQANLLAQQQLQQQQQQQLQQNQQKQTQNTKQVAPTTQPAVKKGKSKEGQIQEQQIGKTKVKKSKSAYIAFIEKNIAQVKSDNPGLEQAQIMKKTAEIWNSMDEVQKAPYKQIASDDKQRQVNQIQAQNPEKAKPAVKAPKARKERKGGITSYMVFSKLMREQYIKENPKISQNEVMTKSALQWKELTDDQKLQYKKMADQVNSQKEMTKALDNAKLNSISNGQNNVENTNTGSTDISQGSPMTNPIDFQSKIQANSVQNQFNANILGHQQFQDNPFNTLMQHIQQQQQQAAQNQPQGF
ncbi:UNKNOWN [Stylonychia lemnae]|uniref:HMG box domain-containing protein n=1 Tax=Stylonychia lemnae TaxID=5949 RepID=A0A078ASU9_STYLE|nr:UNKNOWN [Stylonychia lemnae]|eukprot:CDW83903.1 UNKNOWN [Stylonychia lemnae]